jgi:hypothetical protein
MIGAGAASPQQLRPDGGIEDYRHNYRIIDL